MGGVDTSEKAKTTDNLQSASNNKLAEESAKKSIVTKADVHTPSESQEPSLNEIASEIKGKSSESIESKQEAEESKVSKEGKDSKEEEKMKEKDSVQSVAAAPQPVSTDTMPTDEKPSVESISVQEQQSAQSQSNAASPQKEGSQEKKDEGKQQTDNVDSAQADDKSAKMVAKTGQSASTESAGDSKLTKKPSSDEVNQTKGSDTAAKPEPNQKTEVTSNDQTENTNQTTTVKVTDAPDENKPNADASDSLQVLPKANQPSDNLNQEKDDTGNLGPPNPPTETIRKTSFTVLKSDESIDDLLAGMDENNEMNADDKPLSHVKSFKVLKAHAASGEDILLQPSSDQETGGNDNYEDYLTRNLAQYSGKYSDSELISAQLNGRRKKYKKRAKSVKQLTIMDGPSKDQDSGFEPSPRTIRSSKASTTRAIYTANLPERPRVGDIIDCRSASSRFEPPRKLGDKNAVNMTTVSQTLQRNIRRFASNNQQMAEMV